MSVHIHHYPRIQVVISHWPVVWRLWTGSLLNIHPCTYLSVVISHYHSLTANMRNENIRLIEYPSLHAVILGYKFISHWPVVWRIWTGGLLNIRPCAYLSIAISHYHSLTAIMRNEDIRLIEYPSLYAVILGYKLLSVIDQLCEHYGQEVYWISVLILPQGNMSCSDWLMAIG